MRHPKHEQYIPYTGTFYGFSECNARQRTGHAALRVLRGRRCSDTLPVANTTGMPLSVLSADQNAR